MLAEKTKSAHGKVKGDNKGTEKKKQELGVDTEGSKWMPKDEMGKDLGNVIGPKISREVVRGKIPLPLFSAALRFTKQYGGPGWGKYLPNMNKFCDWFRDTKVISVHDSFF